MAEPWTALLSGPMGGLLATAFGSGCVAGYSFAMRTALAVARSHMDSMKASADEQHAECKAELAEVKAELADMRDMLMGRKPMPPFSIAAPRSREIEDALARLDMPPKGKGLTP